MRLFLPRCRKCRGNVQIERDEEGVWILHCIQCGFWWPVMPMPILKYRFDTSRVTNPYRVNKDSVAWRDRPSLSSTLRPSRRNGWKHPSPHKGIGPVINY